MTMLPIVSNQVRPWFEAHGATLDDAQSFRIMIASAERDIASLEKLMPEYRLHASDIAELCDVELAAAHELVDQMKSRLAELAPHRDEPG